MPTFSLLVLPSPGECLQILDSLPLAIYIAVQPSKWDSRIPCFLRDAPELPTSTAHKISARLDCTHLFYQLQNALLSLDFSMRGKIYDSLHAQLPSHSKVISSMAQPMVFADSHSDPLSLQAGYHSLPPELLHHCCQYLDPASLLMFRLVHRASRIVASHHSHTTLHLSLPPNWQDFSRMSLSNTRLLVSDIEIMVTLFIKNWHVGSRATMLILDNWPLNRAAFFYHILPKLTTVIIRGRNCSPNHVPVIRHPFLVPPNVHHLVLQNCMFQSHTLETMLLPATQVQTLELQNVKHGHVPIISHNPTPEERRRFQDRMAITSHLSPEIMQPISATLQRLSLHSPNYDELPGRLQPYSSATAEPFRAISGFTSLLQQIFQRPEMVAAVQKFLEPLQLFPRRINPAHITELDLRLAMNHFQLIRPILLQLQNTLQNLTIHIPNPCMEALLRNEGYVCSVSLSGLPYLQHLRLYTAPFNFCFASQTCQSWDAPTKTLPTATFQLYLNFSSHQTDHDASIDELVTYGYLKRLLFTHLPVYSFQGLFLLSLHTEAPFLTPIAVRAYASSLIHQLMDDYEILARVSPLLIS